MQHIVKSLTVENVPYEMFSTFSAIFEDVRKVNIAAHTLQYLSQKNLGRDKLFLGQLERDPHFKRNEGHMATDSSG